MNLDKLEQLEKAATPGPWTDLSVVTLGDSNSYNNKKLTLKLRNSAPELIRIARAAQEIHRVLSLTDNSYIGCDSILHQKLAEALKELEQ